MALLVALLPLAGLAAAMLYARYGLFHGLDEEPLIPRQADPRPKEPPRMTRPDDTLFDMPATSPNATTADAAGDLWAIHIGGPDSIIARPSREQAELDAAALNKQCEEYKRRPDASEHDAYWHAVVVLWTGTAEEHAEELATDDGDWF